MFRSIGIACLAVLCVEIAACGSSPKKPGEPFVAETPSRLLLSEDLLSAHGGSIDELYEFWIRPLNNKDAAVPHESKKAMLVSEAAVKDGFMRFCQANLGTVQTKLNEYGATHSCTSRTGGFVAEVSSTRYNGNLLGVTFDSPDVRRRIESRKRDFEARKSLNGPTGWVETDSGKFKFLRIGTLKVRHVLEIEADDESMTAPVEEVARIDFPACCKVVGTLRNGSVIKANSLGFGHLTSYRSRSVYGAGKYGMPFVLIDSSSGQPYTRIFSERDSIKSIILDPESTGWKGRRAEALTTQYNPTSPQNMDVYIQKLRLEAGVRYEEAEKRGWIKMLPDGKLTPSLSSHLERELMLISTGSDCQGNAVDGFVNVEAIQKCKVAAKELDLVVRQGYSLVTSVTPLSTLITLDKIQRDLR